MRLFGRPLRLVISDVDGVILDLVASFKKNLTAAAQQLGLPPEPIEQYLADVAAGSKRGYASLSEGIREFWPHLSKLASDEYVVCFRKIEYESPYPPIAGSVETIRWFCDRGVPVALCTTNDIPVLKRRMEAVGLPLSTFAALSTWESGTPKPDPRALDPIFAAIPVKREDAVFAGDWYPDLKTARGGGVRFVAVLSGGIPKSAFLEEGVPENHIISRLSDIRYLVVE